MIKRIYTTEKAYIACFCQVEALEHYWRLKDDHIKDMYSHNFILIEHDTSSEDILKIVHKEIEHRRKEGKKYLRVVTSAEISQELIDGFNCKPDVEDYDYYGIKTSAYKTMRDKDKASVLKADKPDINQDGRMVDIVANYQSMTLEFAIRRIDRKFKVYSSDKALDLYVCYDGIEPVGNCELFSSGDLAKIEDFDIIEMHQRKGFGSYVIKRLLKVCHDSGIGEAYLVTDHDDTAKDMYLKCGFHLVGHRKELMFHL